MYDLDDTDCLVVEPTKIIGLGDHQNNPHSVLENPQSWYIQWERNKKANKKQPQVAHNLVDISINTPINPHSYPLTYPLISMSLRLNID